MKKATLIFLFSILLGGLIAQQPVKNTGVFKTRNPGYYQNSILPGIEAFAKRNNPAIASNTAFRCDLEGIRFPSNINDYKPLWHNKPLSQGNSGTCWAFGAISYFESEIKRSTGTEIKLSEMYIVYWEYVERAKRFVHERGKSYFSQGSEANGVNRMMKMYGIVPQSAYTGFQTGQTVIDHDKMFDEMEAYLKGIETSNAWNEAVVISTIRSILDHYMGAPPTKFVFEGKEFTPEEFLNKYLKINPNDHVSFISIKSETWHQRAVLKEDDNWWKSDDYYNIPIEEYMNLIDYAIGKGHSVALCGDISEPGIDAEKEIAIIPTFDIPYEYIDDDARQMRWSNKTTTDDHCIHIVGSKKEKDYSWYLIKDSGSGAFDGPNKGYRFFRSDYIKLKMVTIMMHKDAATPALDKIIK
jgi:bleomycin hydrolase